MATMLTHLFLIHGGRTMPVNVLLFAGSIASWTLASAGVTMMAVASASIEEHADAILWAAGLLLVLVGFWIRDWKAKREAFEKMIAEKVSHHADGISRLEENTKNLAEGIRNLAEDARHLAEDTRRFHRWAYEVFPPDDRQPERERRRREALAPHNHKDK